MNDYERIARIIRYLDEHQELQPGLTELAAEAGLSPYHFHRLFCRWAGVTPKDFLQCLTLSRAHKMLRDGKSVLHAALDVGLSGPSRLHDLCVGLDAASPGELKSGGGGWTILAGLAESPFGTCLVGESPRGICHLSFGPPRDERVAAAEIQSNWPLAGVEWNHAIAERNVAAIFQDSEETSRHEPLRAYVAGSPFQVRVWRALLKIPSGNLVSYGQLAESLGTRSSARAVGTAVGKNPLAYLIPCHRVIRETGVIGQYRWDRTRKKAMIAWEGAKCDAAPERRLEFETRWRGLSQDGEG